MIARILGLALSLLPGLAAAAEPALVSKGQLTWGASPTFTPFEFERDGKPAGFDVDMVAALAARLKLQPSLTAMEYKGLIPALLGDRIDIVVSGMYVTAQREEVATFIPYMTVGNQVIVRKGNPLGITGRDTLCGHHVAVPISTAFEASAKQAGAECRAAGKPDVDVLSLPGSNNVALALQQGRADAAVNSTATAAAMMTETPDAYELAGPAFDDNTRVGIALRKDEPELKSRLDAALHAMAADGSYAALLQKWNLPAKSSVF